MSHPNTSWSGVACNVVWNLLRIAQAVAVENDFNGSFSSSWHFPNSNMHNAFLVLDVLVRLVHLTVDCNP